MVCVVAGFPGCGGVLTAPSGDIRSPNHPDRYRENMDCEWHIQLPIGERVRLTFLTFSLEDSAGCYFDYVSVSNSIDIFTFTYLLTSSLTPGSRVLLEKLTGSQLVKKLLAFYGT
jgi:hypothetical protein